MSLELVEGELPGVGRRGRHVHPEWRTRNMVVVELHCSHIFTCGETWRQTDRMTHTPTDKQTFRQRHREQQSVVVGKSSQVKVKSKSSQHQVKVKSKSSQISFIKAYMKDYKDWGGLNWDLLSKGVLCVHWQKNNISSCTRTCRQTKRYSQTTTKHMQRHIQSNSPTDRP